VSNQRKPNVVITIEPSKYRGWALEHSSSAYYREEKFSAERHGRSLYASTLPELVEKIDAIETHTIRLVEPIPILFHESGYRNRGYVEAQVVSVDGDRFYFQLADGEYRNAKIDELVEQTEKGARSCLEYVLATPENRKKLKDATKKDDRAAALRTEADYLAKSMAPLAPVDVKLAAKRSVP